MALRKIIEVEGEAFVQTQSGNFSLGKQKGAFTAYCKIINITGNKLKGRIIVECSGDKYKITEQFDVPLSVDENAPNFIKQAYIELKKLPEWADAIDC